MKSIAKAILVGGFILASQAAVADGSAFPGASDDAGGSLPAKVTYQSEHANDPVTSAGSAFAGSDPSWIVLPPKVTYQSEHVNDPVMSAGSAFPDDGVDGWGERLPVRDTYAAHHLDNPAQGAESSGN